MLDVPSMEGLGVGAIALALGRNVNVLILLAAFAISIRPIAAVAVEATQDLTGVSAAKVAWGITVCVENAALPPHRQPWRTVIAVMSDAAAVGSLTEHV
jgi:hypothetical protein